MTARSSGSSRIVPQPGCSRPASAVFTFITAIRSFVAYVFVIAYVVIIGTPALLIGLATGTQKHLIVLGIW